MYLLHLPLFLYYDPPHSVSLFLYVTTFHSVYPYLRDLPITKHDDIDQGFSAGLPSFEVKKETASSRTYHLTILPESHHTSPHYTSHLIIPPISSCLSSSYLLSFIPISLSL